MKGADMRSTEQLLRNYARLALYYGLGFDQTPRPLYADFVETEDPYGFAGIFTEEAYMAGAPTVDIVYRNVGVERAQFLRAPDGCKLYVPEWRKRRAEEIVARDGAWCGFGGNGGLGVLDDVDPVLPPGFRSEHMKMAEPHSTERISMRMPWNLMSVPTEAWARKIGVSVDTLWHILFQITGADKDDPLGYALGVSDALHKRCAALNALQIEKLHVLGGGTDLVVGLSDKARWLGGRKSTPLGHWFGPNWPSFEVFTTPDYRRVRGWVRITQPSVISGVVVEGLYIHFTDGVIDDFSATKNGEAFAALIARDPGARRLGEFAGVDMTSPISQVMTALDLLFWDILYSENSRGHIATGRGFPAALQSGEAMNQDELDHLGCNYSLTHHDMMYLDETVSVYGLCERGAVQLIEHGYWLPPFA